ncbi:uncharacterized protein LOC124387585 isoform X2 [Silurus meridionalis]|uniref:uncharacterized protein LOC124387585 isoform X2 n=1 Tax=Silurus meridionalis TaxID=175797 RepID=UPI001EEBD4C3|nr:uncharacterized protein LOC124387585 isoform X2 [Silurus meridionalis]
MVHFRADMFFPGLLMLLICLQTFTSAQIDYVGGSCCFRFQRPLIPVRLITKYEVTDPYCPKPGVIFTLKHHHHLHHHRRVCADPEDTRVGRIMYRIDRLRFDSHAPQLCCYRFHVHPIPARLITGYKVTDHQCNNHGVIFILKDNRNFCVDPNENWVQNIMNTTDKTENAKTQELLCHYGRGPGHCCFSFHDDQIYSEFITGYEETAHHSPNHGIIFSLKDGRRVCTNYNNDLNPV